MLPHFFLTHQIYAVMTLALKRGLFIKRPFNCILLILSLLVVPKLHATTTYINPNKIFIESTISSNVNADSQQIALVSAGTFIDTDGDECADVGETIRYTFTVTNLGNESLTEIILEDYLFQAPNSPVEIVFTGGDTDGDNELDINEIWIYNADYALTQADIDLGRVDNQARVSAIVSGSIICENSGIWGENGELWDSNGLLQDFSNVGYMEGNVAIPDWPNGPDVTEYGAVGDGIHDDTQAFRDAIAACPDNMAVYVPNGRYKITDWIKVDNQDNFVLRGQDMYETVLWFPNNLSEIRPENNYIHADGGGFIYFNGGTHRSIENFTLEFREEQNGTHFNGSGANGIFMGGVEHSWIRNIYVKNANLGLRVNGDHITIANIVLDHYSGRPKTDGIFPNKVGHYGITLSNATNSLVHDVVIVGEWFHDIGTHQAAHNNVFSRVKSLSSAVITHKSLNDSNNMYTEFDLGEGTRFSGDSRPNTVYWNIKAETNLPYPSTDVNNVAVGLTTDLPSSMESNHWHETINPDIICPSNLYLAQLELAEKTFYETPLKLPPFWPAPDPTNTKPTDDTYIDDRTDVPHGNSWKMIVGSNPFRVRSPFLKFDLTQSILTNVDKATLRLYKNSWTDSAKEVAVRGLEDDSWTEDTLTYYSDQPTGAIYDVSFTWVESEAGWYELDVTSFVNMQLAGDKIVSLSLDDNRLLGSALTWIAKESDLNHPELILTPATDAPPQPPIPPEDFGNATVVTDLSGSAEDNDIFTSIDLCQSSLNTNDFVFEDLKIIPNPFIENITINLPQNLSQEQFKVFIVDISGRVVLENINLNDGELLIPNLNNLESALYFITIESKTSNLSITKKIIKQ